MDRAYLEAIVMGVVIGLAALGLTTVLGEAGLLFRLLGLLVVGGALCLAQYGLIRSRRR